jgi:type IV pilus biogenesis protein CpaD/CtpE
MLKTKNYFASLYVIGFLLAGCTQSTPSMLNTSKVELTQETVVEQIPLNEITDSRLAVLADYHRQFGTGPLDIAMTYDPKSKEFTAMNASHRLKHVKTVLGYKGVKNIQAQTVAVTDGSPSLIVSYDMSRAQAPSDCAPMPGLENNETGRFIGDYKFGCGVETMFAQQIARPADLKGNAVMDQRDARREAIVVDGYSAAVPREPLVGVERDNIVSE